VKQLQIDSVIVEGHTDSQGSVALNQKLSINRAASVALYLQTQIGNSLFTRGLASEKPVADNRTATGRQKNRRVEIYIYVRE
jgi:outer membrane protein OmpA-like peptidoglycan-associated protein